MDFTELAKLQGPESIFANLTASDWEALAAHAVRVNFAKGKELLAQGEDGDRLLILLSGQVRVSMIAANGREIVLAYAEPGAVLGEIALLDGGERTASVTATSAGTALQLGRNALRTFVATHPDFAWSLLQTMAQRLRRSNQTIEIDRAYASGPRLARYLCRLVGAETGESGARLNMNQTELGNFAGMSREHVNRQLRNWEAAGIIRLEQGKVCVLDRHMLEEISEYDG